jgi:hypothetical protein
MIQFVVRDVQLDQVLITYESVSSGRMAMNDISECGWHLEVAQSRAHEGVVEG